MKHQPIKHFTSSGPGEILSPQDLFRTVVTSQGDKCRQTDRAVFFAGILGGALIGFAGLFYVIVMTDNSLTGGIAKLVGGVSFSLGLVMISVTGAHLFTGNILAILPKAYGFLSNAAVYRNWAIVYIANFFGAAVVGGAATLSGLFDESAGQTMARITTEKLAHSQLTAFVEAILCNILVCLAIWMSLSTRQPTGRFLAIAGPITAFVAMGLEHSVADMFFFSSAVAAGFAPLSGGMALTLFTVTLGNMVGAALLCIIMAQSFPRLFER